MKKAWNVGSFICLIISYILCRFVFFGVVHNMGQFPNLLVIIGLIILIIALILKLKWLSVSVPLGYMGGFVLGIIFNTNGVDAGGGKTNNFWIIWGTSLLVCIVIGLIADALEKRKQAS